MFEALIKSDSTVGESLIVHINWKVYESYAFFYILTMTVLYKFNTGHIVHLYTRKKVHAAWDKAVIKPIFLIYWAHKTFE